MTEERLEQLKEDQRTLWNLKTWLDHADKMPNVRKKVVTLFEVAGWVSEETLTQCYLLVRPELDAAFERLKKEFLEA